MDLLIALDEIACVCGEDAQPALGVLPVARSYHGPMQTGATDAGGKGRLLDALTTYIAGAEIVAGRAPAEPR